MILSVITVASFGSISHISAISGNDNLTKVFDCINQKANERANLSLVDSFVCYDKGLSGASKYLSNRYLYEGGKSCRLLKSLIAGIFSR